MKLKSILNANLLALIAAFPILAHAGNQYDKVSAELAGAKAAGGEAPAGIVEDAARIGAFHLFDDSTYHKIDSAMQSYNANKAEAVEKVRDTLCNGKEPKIEPSISFVLVIPKTPPGTTVGEAAQNKKRLTELTRVYLKSWLLDEVSDFAQYEKKLNSDFQGYKENILDTGGERKYANHRFGVAIPYLDTDSPQGAVSFYKGMAVLSTLEDPPMQFHEWYPSRHYIAVAFPEKRTIVLAPKVVGILAAGWGFKNYGTEMKSKKVPPSRIVENTSLLPLLREEDTFNLRNKAFYTVSENSWRLEDGSVVHPLVLGVVDDLGLLKRLFTFKIPKADLKRIFFMHASIDQHGMAYDMSGDKFSPSLALENRDWIWTKVLQNQIEVNEAPREEGVINYTVKFPLGLFCRYGVSVSALSAP